MMHLCIETHRSPLLLILAGLASNMSLLQSFPHRELAYSILDLRIEAHWSPLFLILADSPSYMLLQFFPHKDLKDLAYSILV